jgi:NADPH:quinone reductase-like Zn-dependent oxidoreductase
MPHVNAISFHEGRSVARICHLVRAWWWPWGNKAVAAVGCRNGGMADAADALAWLARGQLRPVIAARFALEQSNKAFELVRSGEVVGCVVMTLADQ